jgi:hypothetical protein
MRGVASRSLLLLCLPALVSGSDGDNFKLRRVFIDSPALLRALHQRSDLVSLPRAEFDQAWSRRSDRLKAAAEAPRLQSAQYVGQWVGEGQLTGSAELTLLHSSDRPRVFRLEPWNLAVRGRPVLAGQPAQAGEVDGKAFGVILNKKGRHQLSLEWSCQGQQRWDGWRFQFQTPAAPIAELALDLPNQWFVELPGAKQLVPRAEVLATGGRRWHIPLGGSQPAALEVLIRSAVEPSPSRVRVARQLTEHSVSLASVDSHSEVDLEVTPGKATRIQVEIDERLQLLAASLRNASQQALTVTTVASPGRKTLTVELPALAEKRILLNFQWQSRSPVGSHDRWALPWLRVLNASGAREMLRIRAGPEVVFTDWRFADYLPVTPPQVERRGSATLETLTLEQRNLAAPGLARMPLVRARLQGPEFSVRQETWWHVSGTDSSFIARTACDVQAGKLASLTLKTPFGWALEHLEVSPPNLLLEHFEEPADPGRRVILLRVSPEPATPVTVTTRFRLDQPLDFLPRGAVAVPHLVVEGARWQQSTLAISLPKGQFQATLPGAAAAPAPLPQSLPWTRLVRTPDLLVTWFGDQPPGPLTVEPIPAQSRTRARTELCFHSNRWKLRHHVEIAQVSGRMESARFCFAGDPGPIRWHVASGSARIRQERRHEEALITGNRTHVELTFDVPLQESVTLQGELELPDQWDSIALPLLTVPDAADVTGVFHIQSTPGYQVQVNTEGLIPVTAVADPGGLAPGGRSFRYQGVPQRVQLSRKVSDEMKQRPVVTSSTILVRCQPRAETSCEYHCSVLSATADSLTLQLPPGAEFRGLWREGLRIVDVTDRDGLLTVPPLPGLTQFRIQFSIVADGSCGLPRIEVLPPVWQEDVVLLSTRSFVAMPEGWSPLRDENLTRLTQPFSLRRCLADSTTARDIPRLWRLLRAAESPTATSARQSLESLLAERFPPDLEALLQLEAEAQSPPLRFVVDTLAVGPSAPFALTNAWFVRCGDATLVTTKQQLRADGVTGSPAADLHYGARVERALAFGHDWSGRFQSLTTLTNLESLPLLADWEIGPGWILYELTDSGVAAASVILVRSSWAWLAGSILGLLAFAVLWLLRRRGVPNRLLVFAGLPGALALVWLPGVLAPLGWCLLAATAMALFAVKLPGRRTVTAENPSATSYSPAAALGAALLVTGLCCCSPRAVSGADSIREITVYGWTAPDGGERVFVPVSVWKELTDPAFSQLGTRYVLLDAEYTGRVDGESCKMEATYRFETLTEEPVDIPLALGNARLSEASLDQQPTIVAPLPQGEGILVRVIGRGAHMLRLVWHSTLEPRGSDRVLRCTVPAISACKLRLGSPWSGARVANVQGLLTSKSEADRHLVEAECGRTGEFLIEWKTADEAPPQVRVLEQHLWRLGLDAQHLQSRMSFDVLHGAASSVRLRLPTDLEILSVELSVTTSDAPVQLQHWRVEERGGHRHLLVEFDNPARGKFELGIESRAKPSAGEFGIGPLVAGAFGSGVAAVGIGMLSALIAAEPERLLTGTRTLWLVPPTPLDAERVGGRVGVLTNQVVAESLTPGPGLVASDDREDAQPLGRFPGTEKPQHRFQFHGAAGPNLQVRIRPTRPRFSMKQDFALHFERATCQLRGRMELALTEGSLTFLQFQTENFMLMDMHGEDVQRWTQDGDSVQVWLDRRVEDRVTLHLRGWLRATKPERVRLPTVLCPQAELSSTRLELHYHPPISVEFVSFQGLRQLTGPFAEPSLVSAWCAESAYTGELRVDLSIATTPKPALPPPEEPAFPATTPTHWTIHAEEHCVHVNHRGPTFGMARYLLRFETGGVCSIALPPATHVLAISLDGQSTSGEKSAEREFRVNLAPGKALQELKLLWVREDEPSSSGSRRLGLPGAAGERGGRCRLTLVTPFGAQSADVNLAIAPESAALARIEASEDLLSMLQDTRAEALSAGRRSFWVEMARHILAAEASLEQSHSEVAALLTGRLSVLRRTSEREAGRSLGQMLRASSATTSHEETRLNWDVFLPRAGVRTFASFHQPPKELTIELADHSPSFPQRWWATLVLVAFAVVALGCCRFPWLSAWLGPELCALAGLIWWWLLPSWWIGFLTLIAAFAWRGRKTVRWLIQPRSGEAVATVG